MSRLDLVYHDAVIGIHRGPRLNRHVLLGGWHPIYMEEKQPKLPRKQFKFVRCVSRTPTEANRYLTRQPPLDTRVLSPAEYAHIEENYNLVPVTRYASENDCFAITYEKPREIGL